jgi:predicted 3-demethylubiquinone-9 3-methyltransferase (glyoxalase superfamily)
LHQLLEDSMQQITPFLWFDGNAEEAVNFYVSVFPNSKIKSTARYGDAGPGPKGSVMTMSFHLDGMDFVALNGGPNYKFTPAISFVANCETQEQVDHLWDSLVEGGKPMACGWLTDRFGLSWQITPTALMKLLQDKDPARAKRAMQAMMTMVKLDIAALNRAADGEE